tara:strand:- start:193 stop:321 length:129 start_codon:yes stop_codon:yes gene_type:complete
MKTGKTLALERLVVGKRETDEEPPTADLLSEYLLRLLRLLAK